MLQDMARAFREMLGTGLAVLSFAAMAWAVVDVGRHAWLESALTSLLGLLALGAATELLRGSVGE